MLNKFMVSRFSSSLLACGAFFCFTLQSCESNSSNKSQTPVVIPVKVVTYGESLESKQLEFSGTFQENRSVPIAFLVSGRVESVWVRNGDTLNPGTLIASVDSSSLVDAYRVAHAKQIQAQDAYDRTRPLHDSGSVSEVQWVEVQTGLSQATALASLAQKNLEDAVLRAPVRGIVVKKNLEVGQSVGPGLPVLTLVDARFLDAVFSISEKEILWIHPGMEMNITLPEEEEKTRVGKVTEIGIEPDPLSRNYSVRVRLENIKGLLRMGMACHGSLTLPSEKGGEPILPLQAVLEKPNGERYVFVVQDGVARMRPIQIGGFLGEGMRIVKGLDSGEKIVVEGAHGLTDGLRVRY